jgi:hypothetical protein
MSIEIARAAIHLRPSPRPAHTEACSCNPAIRKVTGKDPTKDGSAWKDFYNSWQYDFLWSTNDGPVDWAKAGRSTDMGHAEFEEGGIDRRDTVTCPFHDEEEVYAFDAVQEYGLPDMKELVAYYERCYQEGQAWSPEQLYPGGYYKTIVSGAIQAFGWDMLLAAAADRRRFEKVLDSFFRLSLHYYTAWSQTSIEAFICHDDMVWTAGPFIRPDFYRNVIFPRYKELWKPLIDAGKRVIYCSDGNWTMFLDDIVEAGAHGFNFEPVNDFDLFVQKYGGSHIIIGSKVDCRTLTFGTKEEIRQEIDSTLAVAKNCPGFIFMVGNHIPSNVPVENALFFQQYLQDHWTRENA